MKTKELRGWLAILGSLIVLTGAEPGQIVVGVAGGVLGFCGIILIVAGGMFGRRENEQVQHD